MDKSIISEEDDTKPTTEVGSWNPALRPERQPSPQPLTQGVPSQSGGESVIKEMPGLSSVPMGTSDRALPLNDDWISHQNSPGIGPEIDVASPTAPAASESIASEGPTTKTSAQETLFDAPPSGRDSAILSSASTHAFAESSNLPPFREGETEESNSLVSIWKEDNFEGDSPFGAKVEPQDASDRSMSAPPEAHASSETANEVAANTYPVNGGGNAAWDEKGSEDPAWGVARTETEVFSRLHTVSRTNTFPEVPLSNQTHSEQPVHLPPSQVESMARELETSVNASEDWPKHDSTALESDLLRNPEADTPDSAALPEAESRFEEGLPLVQHEANEDAPGTEDASGKTIDSFFGDASTVEEDFFSQTGAGANEQSPRGLDRKSTSQALGSMDFVFNDSNHNSKTSDEIKSPVETQGPIQAIDQAVEFPVASENPQPEAKSEDLDAAWKAALGDDNLLVDDDELVEDEFSGSLPTAEDEDKAFEKAMAEEYSNVGSGENQVAWHDPAGESRQNVTSIGESPSNAYAPHQPSSSVLTQPQYNHAYTSFSQPPPPQRPAALEKTGSFVDKAREGYQSPYDLPTDLLRPKKRMSAQPSPLPAASAPPPPPRSSSMMSDHKTGQSMGPPRTPSLGPPLNVSQPPSTTQGHAPSVDRSVGGAESPKKPKPRPESGNSFFEELPMVTKPRPSSATGRFTPQTNLPTPPPPRPPAQHMVNPPPVQPPLQQTDPYAQYQLQPPERLDPYTNVPTPPQSTPSPAGLATRYSPRPPSNGSHVPAPNARYSPVPPSQGTQPRNKYAAQPPQPAQPGRPSPPPLARPFQPRTSSPLAVHGQSAYREQREGNEENVDVGTLHRRDGSQLSSPDLSRSVSTSSTNDFRMNSLRPSYGVAPKLQSIPDQQVMPADETVPYTPDQLPKSMSFGASPPSSVPNLSSRYQPNQSSDSISFSPPRRSQTQSPGKQIISPPASISSHQTIQRPASVHDPLSPTSANPYAPFPTQISGRTRGLTQNANFIPPNDGTEHDPLQRWRGSAIAGFGFGGILITTMPKHIPRYTTGHTAPVIKSSPGEVRVRTLKEALPTAAGNIFPGPLRSKSKKKDVLAWLSTRIEAMEKDLWPRSTGVLPDSRKRHEEKILLWKVVKTMVEYDGQLEGSSDVQNALREIISPEISSHQDGSAGTYMTNANLTGISRSRGQMIQPEPTDPTLLENIRRDLLMGDREKAVWSAVDRRLWAHAMLIASTVNKKVWKQVAQEFVRQEVKLVGENTESLAALYEIFAGNWQESIDELVPPSARAGLQMVSKVANSGPTKNALDGLDRWRETLSLVLSNRVPDDHQALSALGNLLAGYGRVEAAHICYLFARSSNLQTVFGGMGDPHANIILLGADHRRQPADFSRDEDAIILTEVYEFAVSVLAVTASGNLPHLQAYKLQRALILAENGFKNDAQLYCDSIGSTFRSTTKMSPYYNAQLFEQLKDLSDRLQQAPSEGSSSWIFKPSMEKVSGSLWGKFSNFVAGDESDGDSKGSGKEGEFGPFAKVVGTPTISRSGSQTDLHTYGGYPSVGQGAPNTSSKYAPAGPYAPRSSSEQQRSSLEGQRSPPYVPASFSQPSIHATLERTLSNVGSQFAQQPSPYQPISSSSRETPGMLGYHPTPPQTSHSPLVPTEGFTSAQQASYFPTPPNELSSFEGYQPSKPVEQTLVHQDSPPSDTAPLNRYEPPSAPSTYEPPSYMPPSYEAPAEGGEDSPVEEKPKKNLSMDDDEDDDIASRAAAIQKAEKERKDRETNEAFKKAAEADAQRPELHKKSSGWFSGWFGKKDPNAPQSGPIKAKLGEELSFAYDPELKKWHNKKDPSSMNTAVKSTPPPPKGLPPSRTGSAMGGGSLPPTSSSVASPGSMANTGPPPPSTTKAPAFQPSTSMPSMPGPPMPAGTPSPQPGTGGPPSRNSSPLAAPPMTSTPPTTSSTPSNGLAPPPTSRPGTTVSNASSIDDLLGAPTARKTGGTAKGKKKGRGYVDVMAK